MDKPIIIQIHPTPEIVNLLEALINAPGVTVGGHHKDLEEYITLRQAAAEVKVNYFTLRSWVVEKKLIPFTRLGGRSRGHIRVMRRHVREMLTGEGQKAKPRRRGGEVSIL
jgi:hypothetical protein